MRILEVIVDLDGGGIDRYVINNCTRIHDIDFEFVLIRRKYNGIMEQFLADKGYKIHKVSRILPNPLKNYREMKTVIRSNKFDAVHIHLGYKGIVALLAAKRCGVKTRILHSHLANVPMNFFKNAIRHVVTYFAKRLATNLVSCGIEAGKWMWGKKALSRGEITILNNAISTADYKFSQTDRDIYRKQLMIEDKFVIGNVGRLSNQKNQLRLLDIFKKVLELEPNSALVLVGDGDLEKRIIEKARTLNISNQVKLLGVRSDVNRLLNCFDVFAFPSIYEGLPFVLIEAQCNGLSIISSDSVSSQVVLTNRVKMLSLKENNDVWARELVDSKRYRDLKCSEIIAESGYDLDVQAQYLQSFYFKCIKQMSKEKKI